MVIGRKKIFVLLQMTNTVETDLTQKLETSTLQTSASGKEAADVVKAEANEAFKSIPLDFFSY